MVLFEVDPQCAAILPVEGYAPRSIDADGIAPAVQLMQTEARKIQVFCFARCVQRVQPVGTSLGETRRNSCASALFKEFLEALVAEARNHRISVYRIMRQSVKRHVTDSQFAQSSRPDCFRGSGRSGFLAGGSRPPYRGCIEFATSRSSGNFSSSMVVIIS